MEAFHFYYQIMNKPLAEICKKYKIPTNLEYYDGGKKYSDPVGIYAETELWDVLPDWDEWSDNTLSEWFSALIEAMIENAGDAVFYWFITNVKHKNDEWQVDADLLVDNWKKALDYIQNNKEEINNATKYAEYDCFSYEDYPYDWEYTEHSDGICEKIIVSADAGEEFEEIAEDLIGCADIIGELYPLAEEAGLIKKYADTWTKK